MHVLNVNFSLDSRLGGGLPSVRFKLVAIWQGLEHDALSSPSIADWMQSVLLRSHLPRWLRFSHSGGVTPYRNWIGG